MSFLVYQKQSPEFLNNYLKYKRFISCCSATTVDQAYFDLRTFFRYISIMFHSNTNIENISVEDFKNISINDITITDMNNIKSSTIVRTFFDYLYRIKHNIFKEPFKEIKR